MRLAHAFIVVGCTWLMLAAFACRVNTELECRSPVDCTDPARPTCEQVPDEPCQAGASATNTQCVPAGGCRCRVGYDPETYTTVPGRIAGESCADPPPDSGPPGLVFECSQPLGCPGAEGDLCVQRESAPCLSHLAPVGTKCQPVDTPGCHCVVGKSPDPTAPYNPGGIVGEYCVGGPDTDAGAGD